MKKHDVFISYKSEDFDTAQWVRSTLEANGISCWMAPSDIPGGSDYAHEIPEAIAQCRIVVVVLSERAQTSIWIPKELSTAVSQKKIVMPFMLEDCKLQDDFNFYFTNVQRYEAYENKSEAIRTMVKEIQAILNVSRKDSPKPVKLPEKKKSRKPLMIILIVVVLAVGAIAGIFGYRGWQREQKYQAALSLMDVLDSSDEKSLEKAYKAFMEISPYKDSTRWLSMISSMGYPPSPSSLPPDPVTPSPVPTESPVPSPSPATETPSDSPTTVSSVQPDSAASSDPLESIPLLSDLFDIKETRFEPNQTSGGEKQRWLAMTGPGKNFISAGGFIVEDRNNRITAYFCQDIWVFAHINYVGSFNRYAWLPRKSVKEYTELPVITELEYLSGTTAKDVIPYWEPGEGAAQNEEIKIPANMPLKIFFRENGFVYSEFELNSQPCRMWLPEGSVQLISE